MIHKAEIFKWVFLVAGIISFLVTTFTLLKGVRRDKIISISVLLFCIVAYFAFDLKIANHNKKAQKYFGVHKLSHYNNLPNYSLEILPNNQYLIYSSGDTVIRGNWDLSASNNETMLLLDGSIFGVGEFEIE